MPRLYCPLRRNVGATVWPLALLPLITLFLTGCPTKGTPTEPASPAASPTTDHEPPTASRSAGISFRTVTKEAGIAYRWQPSGTRPLTILGTIGNGVAFLDYDGDGNLDILLVGPKVALYKGDGKGHFTDVSATTGMDKLKGDFRGCAVGDIDNDGFPDIYLTAYRGGALLHNEGGKSFRDITARSGIASQPFGTASAFGDINGDGFLDLYIGNYVVFGPNAQPQLCENNGFKGACGPRFYDPEKGHIYLGGPGMKFRDVTKIWDAHLVEGKSLGAAFADYDSSGKLSLALSNDEMPGDLLQNHGSKFENVGKISNTAYSDQGSVHGGMGVDWGDYNNDGKLDLAVATFASEQKSVYRNDGDNLFTDSSAILGLAAANPYVAFGLKWLDYDNDGYLDLVIANGHVQDNIADSDKTMTYRQPAQLFHNQAGQRFEDVTASAFDEIARRPLVGRGLAIGDYDNDGKIDILIADSEGEPLLLHNQTAVKGSEESGNHWIGFKLSQPTGGNRDAYGATVIIEAGGRKMMRHCHADGSYMSSSDPRALVGLGDAKIANKVTIRWTDGKTDTFANVAADRYWKLEPGGKLN